MDHSEPNTTGEVLEHSVRLIKYALMQAHADGRPLSTLFTSDAFVGNVVARFMIYEASEHQQLNEELVIELKEHRAQTGGGIDAATWGR